MLELAGGNGVGLSTLDDAVPEGSGMHTGPTPNFGFIWKELHLGMEALCFDKELEVGKASAKPKVASMQAWNRMKGDRILV